MKVERSKSLGWFYHPETNKPTQLFSAVEGDTGEELIYWLKEGELVFMDIGEFLTSWPVANTDTNWRDNNANH